MKTFNICTCKQSQCIKNYCECFSKGEPCNLLCKCVKCHNKLSGYEDNNNNTSNILFITHNTKRFNKYKEMHNYCCSCKKSQCVKKYCICYQNGKPCNENCRCSSCSNASSSSDSFSTKKTIIILTMVKNKFLLINTVKHTNKT